MRYLLLISSVAYMTFGLMSSQGLAQTPNSYTLNLDSKQENISDYYYRTTVEDLLSLDYSRDTSILVYMQARLITVKVIANQGEGSGILVKRAGNRYTVLTNKHVLNGAENYQIQTPDQQTYTAWKESKIDFQEYDLALLNFDSSEKYKIATFGRTDSLNIGDRIISSGFPSATNDSPRNFKFTVGQVSLFTPKTLEGGYQIGYNNAVEKGMSGGPVLNSLGLVIGVNGMHAYPLWGNPYRYTDGSYPCEALQDSFTHFSWAIPIETVLYSAIKMFSTEFIHKPRNWPLQTFHTSMLFDQLPHLFSRQDSSGALSNSTCPSPDY